MKSESGSMSSGMNRGIDAGAGDVEHCGSPRRESIYLCPPSWWISCTTCRSLLESHARMCSSIAAMNASHGVEMEKSLISKNSSSSPSADITLPTEQAILSVGRS